MQLSADGQQQAGEDEEGPPGLWEETDSEPDREDGPPPLADTDSEPEDIHLEPSLGAKCKAGAKQARRPGRESGREPDVGRRGTRVRKTQSTRHSRDGRTQGTEDTDPIVFVVSVCDGIGGVFLAMEEYTPSVRGHACEKE